MKLIDAAAQFPTVFLSILLGIILIYWLFVILGALDIDMFSGDADVDGALDGVGGHGGGDVGMPKDIGLPKDVGLPKDIGAPKDLGIPKGGEVDMGDGSHVAKSGGLLNFLRPLGLSRVPITISATFIILYSWILCMVGIYYLTEIWPEGPQWLIRTIAFFGGLFVSLPLTALTISPLGPVFETQLGKTRADYVGAVCEITTGHVDAEFGQAKIEDGGDVLVIPVRCDSGKEFKRYSKALIIEYDDNRHAYLVEPFEDSALDPK